MNLSDRWNVLAYTGGIIAEKGRLAIAPLLDIVQMEGRRGDAGLTAVREDAYYRTSGNAKKLSSLKIGGPS